MHPMIASAGNNPVSLRISVTDRCQFRCLYCMPATGVDICDHRDVLSFEEIVRFVRLVKSSFDLSKVRLTGGEPLVRRNLVDLVSMLANEGVRDLSLTTNAQCLAAMAGELKQAGSNCVNISLDSLDERTFGALTRGGKLKSTLDGIDAALRENLSPVKLNTIVLKGPNHTDVTDMALWAMSHNCHIRFLELMPIGCAKGIFKELFVSESETRGRLATALHLKALPGATDQSSRDFEATDHYGLRGTVGFIASETHPSCQGCRRLRLTSTGQLISCLARGEGPNVRALLRGDGGRSEHRLREVITHELAAKRARIGFDTLHLMASVGG